MASPTSQAEFTSTSNAPEPFTTTDTDKTANLISLENMEDNLILSLDTASHYHNPERNISNQVNNEIVPLKLSPTEIIDDSPKPSSLGQTTPKAQISKSQKLSQVQSAFTEAQKIAYVGICYLVISNYKATRLGNGKVKSLRKALEAYVDWASLFLDRLFLYLDVTEAGK